MPVWLIVILSCLGVVLGIWLISVIIGVIFLFVNKRQIHRIEVAINIILAQKYDVSIVLAKFLYENKIDLSSKLKTNLKLGDKLNFASFSTLERKSIALDIEELTSELIEIAKKAELEDKKRLVTLMNSIDDVEKQYRHEIISYNNKVWAYNYWINFLPFKPISKLLRLKEKNQMKEIIKEK